MRRRERLVRDLVMIVSLALTAFPGAAQADLLAGPINWSPSPARAEAISELLTGPDDSFERIPQTLFGAAYDRQLPDLIICFNGMTHPTRAVLVRGGKSEERLFGEQFLWVLVFWVGDRAATRDTTVAFTMRADTAYERERLAVVDSIQKMYRTRPDSSTEYELRETVTGAAGRGRHRTLTMVDSLVGKAPSDETDSPGRLHSYAIEAFVADGRAVKPKKDETTFVAYRSLQETRSTVPDSVRAEQLAYRKSVSELGVVHSVLKFLGLSEGSDGAAVPSEQNFPLTLDSLGNDSKQLPVYVGMVKVPVSENTLTRIRVRVGGDREALATVGNYAGSWIGASVGAAAVVPNSHDVRTMRQIEVGPYLFFHRFIQRPKLLREPHLSRLQRVSLSLIGGARVASADQLLDLKDLLFGLSVGHVMGSSGVFLGFRLNRAEATATRPGSWRTGFGVGIDYAL